MSSASGCLDFNAWRSGAWFRFELMPRLRVLQVCAGADYLSDGFARTLLSRNTEYEARSAVAVLGPAFVGELSFAVWLLAKGVDEQSLLRGRRVEVAL